jgi:hypothetical protein
MKEIYYGQEILPGIDEAIARALGQLTLEEVAE